MKTSFELKLSHKALILVAVPLFFELAFVGTLSYLLGEAEAEAFRERHARAISAESSSLLKNFMDAGILLHLYKTTRSEAFLRRLQELRAQIPRQFRSLQIMVADSPREKIMVEKFAVSCRKAVRLLTDAERLIGDGSEAFHWAGSSTELAEVTEELVSGLRSFVKEQESNELLDTNAEGKTRLLIRNLLAAGVLLNIAIALALAFYFNRGTTSRLLVLVDNTKRLARGNELAPKLSGADEIALLDNVFHDMAEALDDAARRKQELVSMVTHDLRTPLTSIQSTLTLLDGGVLGDLPERASRKVAMALDSTARLISLINDLLDIEKLEAGLMKIDEKEQDLNPIVENSLNSVQAFADAASVKLDYQPGNFRVKADSDRLVQVLVNLLSNAVKFSDAASTVKIEAEAIENMLELRVIDQGRGIPEEHLSQVFERFAQVDPNNPVEKKGTGLGLPICKKIVEAHGGTIGVRSKPGQGSCFWFRVKLAGHV
ncbi:MAG: HAMP domain-containing histidine kinase [Candidatus Obscuribacterales bacterium]|nr:HAMP domain-containing histidine kinase [Candidatus Obscuribacterales bacterium]